MIEVKEAYKRGEYQRRKVNRISSTEFDSRRLLLLRTYSTKMRVLILLCLVLPALSISIDQSIVGGGNVAITSHPHQMSLRQGSHICGCQLIATNKATTAAHCGGSAANTYTVLGGTTDRTVTNCATCNLRTCTSFNRHGSFVNNGNTGYPNDVATLYFPAVATSGSCQPIAHAVASDGNHAGNTCWITGWGRTSSTSALPSQLQGAQMVVLTNAACANTWGNQRINNGHICVSNSGRSACSGDSGGPLICAGKCAGLTSWGEASCSPNFPSVYTRINNFNAWINGN